MNQIIRNLYIGDMRDAAKPSDCKVLCVMWKGEDGIPSNCHQIETTDYRNSLTGVRADPAKMDEAADWICRELDLGERVLVHCAYGVERSPLTVVWFLMRYKNMNFTEAYALVQSRRPEAQYRGGWMPDSVKVSGILPERIPA